ncbi:MAG: hypothetical protein NC336_03195 [Clostridium sp.]|nr:hypothetical protein [Clostridium sp.]
MKTNRFFRTFISGMLCIAMAMPVTAGSLTSTEQSSRERQHNNSQRDRKNNNGNRGGQRPGARHNGSRKPQQSGRPGNQNNGQRPGNNGGNNQPQRPPQNNGNHQGNNRPGNNSGHSQPQRPPQNNHRPQPQPSRPGVRPPSRPGGYMTPPPARPYRPVVHSWHSPVPPPPPSWRPGPRVPRVSTILGIAFGTALATSIDMLLNSGYNVDGYQNGVVYLRDVNQLNNLWPDAMLYYDNGALVGSQYSYSTPYSDRARYSMVYNALMSAYGAPVSVTTPAYGATLATWYTPGSGYITLGYAPETCDGAMRFYTTLRVGRY